MSVQSCVRQWLGIDAAISHAYNASMIADTNARELKALCSSISVHNLALARIITKLDPMYGKDELDPQRRADSNRIADEVLNRIRTENTAASKYNP